MRVDLEYETRIDLDYLSAGIELQLIRLVAIIQFKAQDGWSDEFRAIIDTGSPLSVIPKFIWEEIEVKWLLPQRQQLVGIGASGVSGRLAEVRAIFSDEQKISPAISFKAHLLDDDTVPLLIGYGNLLTDLKLFSDYKNKVAYLKW